MQFLTTILQTNRDTVISGFYGPKGDLRGLPTLSRERVGLGIAGHRSPSLAMLANDVVYARLSRLTKKLRPGADSDGPDDGRR